MGLRANFWKILRSGDSDIYELRIRVDNHVEKGSDFRHRTSFWE